MARKISRRKFLYAAGIGAAGVVLSGDALLETFHPHLVRREVALHRLPRSFDGFTIAHLSDFHYDERFSAAPIRRAVEMVNQQGVDLTVLTGDFVTVPTIQTQPRLRQASLTALPCAAVLERIQGPKFAVMGNHDIVANAGYVVRVFEDHGIPVLRNRSVPIERGNERLWLAGIDDLLRGRPKMAATMQNIPPDEATVLLAHEPDFADNAVHYPVDLQLSGHSHGGQIWIPGIGAPWLPPLARKYPRGLYRLGKLTLYTNCGIGTIRAPIRFNCPPEVTILRLRAGA
jgi:predicted MPP superfamily phosphohydrolase